MALSGTVNSAAYEERYVQLTWTATQSLENNTSTISWALTGAGGSTGKWYMSGGFYVEIDGNVVCNWDVNWTDRIKMYNGTSIASGSITLAHDADGSKTFTININAGIYTLARNCSGSGTFTLNTIARASQPSCITYPNNTKNVGDLGGTILVHMNRKSTNFTHTVRYSWYSVSGTIATGVADNCQWTIPLSFATQIPSSTSGWGTIYVDTYNGSTKIGTKSCRFDATVPASIKPTVKSVSATLDNSSNSVVAGWGVGVAGISKVKITASASGSYSSSISSYTISGGVSASQAGSSLNYTSGALSSGNKTFNITATDTRGRVSDSVSTSTITVYAYSKPSFSSFTIYRKPSEQNKVSYVVRFSCSSVNGNNTATAYLYYKKSTETAWTTYGELASGTSKSASGTLTTEFPVEYSYDFIVTVWDTIGNSASKSKSITTASVLLDFRAGGKGLGIGKIAETDAMEVDMPAKFLQTIYLNHTGSGGGVYVDDEKLLIPEVGSWTPTVSGAASYTTQTGWYIRIGDMAVVTFSVYGTFAGSTTSRIYVSGCPLSSTNNHAAGGGNLSGYTAASNIIFTGWNASANGNFYAVGQETTTTSANRWGKTEIYQKASGDFLASGTIAFTVSD